MNLEINLIHSADTYRQGLGVYVKLDDPRMEDRQGHISIADGDVKTSTYLRGDSGDESIHPSSLSKAELLSMLRPVSVQQDILSKLGQIPARVFFDTINAFLKNEADTAPIALILPLATPSLLPHAHRFHVLGDRAWPEARHPGAPPSNPTGLDFT